MDFAIINAESQCGTLYMPALDSAGAGIDMEEIEALVILHQQDVGMSANEYVRLVLVNEGQRLQVIAAWAPSYVLEQDFLPLTFKEFEFGIYLADVLPVTVSVDSHHWLEGGYRVRELSSPSEVPGVPELVHRGKELLDFGAEDPVSI